MYFTCNIASMMKIWYYKNCFDFFRRSMIETAVLGSLTSDDDFKSMLRVITWLPLCWHQINRCLESNSAGDVTIGKQCFVFLRSHRAV